MKFLSFGSLNIDHTYQVDHFVQKGETLSSLSLNIFSGGKGMNQSIALSRAGADVYHAGCIGKDGLFLLDQLKQAGVHTELIKVLEDVPTGHAIIQNDQEGDNCILLYGGANQSITKEYVDEVLSHFEEGDYLVLQNEINNLDYIITQAHLKKMMIVLNPSPMNNIIHALPLDYINYFILNKLEACQLLNRDVLDAKALCDMMHKKFPKAKIVLTLGEKGSCFMKDNTIRYQSAYKVEAVDTTAAGDTFTGYFLAFNNSLKALDMASRASAITVTKRGAAPSIPTLKEVEEHVFN
mgnify:CR=1 FL=1